GEALLHAVDTLNVCPSSSLDRSSSHERRFGKKPKLRILRTRGCLALVCIPGAWRQRKEKWQTRVRTSIVMGYAKDKKGYKLIDVKTGAVITAHVENIRFDESFTV
ncbi:polyprotein, partial [Phytophthora megakarya]